MIFSNQGLLWSSCRAQFPTSSFPSASMASLRSAPVSFPKSIKDYLQWPHERLPILGLSARGNISRPRPKQVQPTSTLRPLSKGAFFFADFDRFSFLGSPLHQLRPVALSQPPFQLLHLPASLRGPTMSFLPSPLLHLHHNQGHFPPSPHPRQRQLQIKIGRQILCSRCNRPPALLLSQPSPPHPCP